MDDLSLLYLHKLTGASYIMPRERVYAPSRREAANCSLCPRYLSGRHTQRLRLASAPCVVSLTHAMDESRGYRALVASCNEAYAASLGQKQFNALKENGFNQTALKENRFNQTELKENTFNQAGLKSLNQNRFNDFNQNRFNENTLKENRFNEAKFNQNPLMINELALMHCGTQPPTREEMQVCMGYLVGKLDAIAPSRVLLLDTRFSELLFNIHFANLHLNNLYYNNIRVFISHSLSQASKSSHAREELAACVRAFNTYQG